MMLSGLNVYDMSRVSSSFHGYYMTKEGDIYSAKAAPGRLVRLMGSPTASGRYFTLNGTSYRHDRLKAQMQTRLDFKQEFASSPASVQPQPKDRAHADSTDAGVSAKGYLIGRVTGDAIVLGSKPKIHLTLKSVNSEMERLAGQYPGVKFVRLKVDGSVVAGGVKWE